MNQRFGFFLILCIASLTARANAGKRDIRTEYQIQKNRDIRTPRRAVLPRKTQKKQEKTEETPSPIKQVCPLDKIKTQLDSYCATVVCNSASNVASALKLGGTVIDTLDSDCQAKVWQEIAGRLTQTFTTFKAECDTMNAEYANAIKAWESKYNEMADNAKKARTGRNIAIGVGAATTIGSGIVGYGLGKKAGAAGATTPKPPGGTTTGN